MSELGKDDRELATYLAKSIAGMYLSDTPDAWEEIQADGGWTIDRRQPGLRHWKRIEGRKAEDWPAVKAAALQLSNDAEWLENV